MAGKIRGAVEADDTGRVGRLWDHRSFSSRPAERERQAPGAGGGWTVVPRGSTGHLRDVHAGAKRLVDHPSRDKGTLVK